MGVNNFFRDWWNKDTALYLLILADITFQLFRHGGNTLYDQFVHFLFLCSATAVLLTKKKLKKIPVLIAIFPLILFATIVIQLIPLPAWLLNLMAPTKTQFIQILSTLAPGADVSSSITLIPSYHLSKMGPFFLDTLFLVILYTGPRLPRSLFLTWLIGISVLLSSFSLYNQSKAFPTDVLSWLGPPENNNQFAGLLVFISSILLGFLCATIHKIKKSGPLSSVNLPKSTLIVTALSLNAFTIISLDSRSGFFLLILLFTFIPLWLILVYQSKRTVFFSVVLGVLLIAPLFVLPTKKLSKKIALHGVTDPWRIEFNKKGVALLSQGNPLGTGLGSSAGLIGFKNSHTSSQAKEVTEFHNDLLQLIVELGLPGVILVVLLLWWMYIILSGIRQNRHPSQQFFLLGILTSLLLIGALSLVSFPIRIPGIRLLVILSLAIGIKMSIESSVRSRTRLSLVVLFLTCSIAFVLTSLPRLKYLQDPNPVIARAARYGTVHHIPLFKSSEALSALLHPTPSPISRDQLIQTARLNAISAVEAKPTDIRPLNVLFMLDLMEGKPLTSRSEFDQFEERARRIRAFGEMNNQKNHLARYILFSQAPQLLTPHEKEELRLMQQQPFR